MIYKSLTIYRQRALRCELLQTFCKFTFVEWGTLVKDYVKDGIVFEKEGKIYMYSLPSKKKKKKTETKGSPLKKILVLLCNFPFAFNHFFQSN